MGWLQFRLRTLLLFTVVVAVLAFFWAQHRQRLRQLERRHQPLIFSEEEFNSWLQGWDDSEVENES